MYVMCGEWAAVKQLVVVATTLFYEKERKKLILFTICLAHTIIAHATSTAGMPSSKNNHCQSSIPRKPEIWKIPMATIGASHYANVAAFSTIVVGITIRELGIYKAK